MAECMRRLTRVVERKGKKGSEKVDLGEGIYMSWYCTLIGVLR